jgi:hypothetical protein
MPASDFGHPQTAGDLAGPHGPASTLREHGAYGSRRDFKKTRVLPTLLSDLVQFGENVFSKHQLACRQIFLQVPG